MQITALLQVPLDGSNAWVPLDFAPDTEAALLHSPASSTIHLHVYFCREYYLGGLNPSSHASKHSLEVEPLHYQSAVNYLLQASPLLLTQESSLYSDLPSGSEPDRCPPTTRFQPHHERAYYNHHRHRRTEVDYSNYSYLVFTCLMRITFVKLS